MARPKIKDSKAITVRLDSKLFDKLNEYCEKSGQTKTTAVERALAMFIEDYNEKMKKLNS